jgi:uncharacterized protein YcbK (DUF882 family)
MPANSFISRRSFIGFGAFGVIALHRSVLSAMESGASAFSKLPERRLSFLNLHTSEKLSRVYWAEGAYIPESLQDLNQILRDYRTGDVIEIAPRLLDTLCEVRMRMESNEPFELISGYRSPKTNALLRQQGHGVAEKSLHTKGMAADVRIAGRPLVTLRKTAIAMQAGGVGYYPASQFVHVDIGRVRSW